MAKVEMNGSLGMTLSQDEHVLNYDIGIPQSDVEISSQQEEDYLLPELQLFDTDWIFLTTNFIAMVLSLVSNIFVIYFICGQKRARSAQNISIVSVAVANISIACFVIPTHVVIHTLHAERYSDDISPFLCKLHTYTWYWCKTVTVYSILALICDRYTRVAQPTKSHILSGRYMFFLSFVWFFGSAYNVWEIVLKASDYATVVSPAGENYTLRTCVTAEQFRYLQHYLVSGNILVIYVIPVSAAAFMYGSVVRMTCKRTDSRHRVTSKKRLLMSVFLLLLFIFCQLPLDIVNIVIFVTNRFTYGVMLVKKITEVISFSQGTLNIVVYAMFSSEIHVAIKRQCGKTKSRYYARVNLHSRGVRSANGKTVPAIEVRCASTDELPSVSVEMTVMDIQVSSESQRHNK